VRDPFSYAPGMQVEIWSDVVCPWCYIGKRRFEAALARFDGRDDVEVTWRSFELDPQGSRDPIDLTRLLAEKYDIQAAEAAERHARTTATAADVGLELHLEKARSGNTMDAHRVIHLAREHGLQDAAKERLLRAYFVEGRPISDRETLVELGASIGLDPGELRAMLESDRFADDVRDDERTAARFGINGVPFFVLDRKLGVSGAQPVEVLVGALEQAAGDGTAA
jgi:predicted DsbA family dithiol-disulfide isomerase